jgi:hypothetical protein
MGEHDFEQCAAQLHAKVAIAVQRVLSGLGDAAPTVSDSMLADLGIAATSELNTEAPWTRDEFRLEAIENVASPGRVVFQPQALTPWAREVFELAEKLADLAEEEAEDASKGRD